MAETAERGVVVAVFAACMWTLHHEGTCVVKFVTRDCLALSIHSVNSLDAFVSFTSSSCNVSQ